MYNTPDGSFNKIPKNIVVVRKIKGSKSSFHAEQFIKKQKGKIF